MIECRRDTRTISPLAICCECSTDCYPHGLARTTLLGIKASHTGDERLSISWQIASFMRPHSFPTAVGRFMRTARGAKQLNQLFELPARQVPELSLVAIAQGLVDALQ